MDKQQANKNEPSELFATIFIILYQLTFFGCVFVVMHGLWTFNLWIIGGATLLVIVQYSYTGRNSIYLQLIAPIVSKYFKIKRIYDDEVPQQEKTLFSFTPHSIFCYGMLANMNNTDYPPNEKLSHLTGLSSRFALSLPIWGFLFKIWGLFPVNPENLASLMKKQKTIGMVPGGFEEATITSTQELRIFIESRKGFIKYALKYGYKIRPVLILKEHQILCTFDHLTNFRLFLNKFKIPMTIFWNRFGLLFPPNKEIITIVGRAVNRDISVEQGQSASTQLINKVHENYKEQISRLYEKYKQENNNKPLKFY